MTRPTLQKVMHAGGSNVEQNYELDYWNLLVAQAFDIIRKDLSEKESATIGALNVTTMWGLKGNWEILPQNVKVYRRN